MLSWGGSSGKRNSSRETQRTSRGVTLPAAGLRFTLSSRMVPAGTGAVGTWEQSPTPGEQSPTGSLTVQQRSRGPVQHTWGALGDPFRHQRGAGAHQLHRELAAGCPLPLQRPVVQHVHHGLLQGCVGAGG